MSDADLSSCSYLTEAEDPVVSAKDATIRELQYEKQRLEEMNKNLQTSLEKVKQQLKETLDAVDTSNAVNEQIQQLKNENAELVSKKEQLAKQLELVTSTSNDATKNLSDKITEVTQQRDEALSTLANYEERISKLKKEKNMNKVELQEKAELLQAFTEDYQKCKQQKKKAQQKLQILSEKLAEAEQLNEQLNVENQKLINENTTLVSENDSLKLKVDAAIQFNDETEQSLKQLHKEMEQKVNIISTLEAQFEAQREELQNFSDERQRILEILQLMQKSLATAEVAVASTRAKK